MSRSMLASFFTGPNSLRGLWRELHASVGMLPRKIHAATPGALTKLGRLRLGQEKVFDTPWLGKACDYVVDRSFS